MASSTASTVDDYLAELPDDRRAAIAAIRATINASLPDGFEESMQYGMISWCVPLSRYPDTYNGQPLAVVSLASQKGYMALYLVSVYSDPDLERWFRAAYAASGKKIDMGKSCVRFASLDALPLDVVGETIAKVTVDDFIARYEAVRGASKKPSARTVRAKAQVSAKKSSTKKSSAKPSTKKSSAKKSSAKPSTKKSSAKPSTKKSSTKKSSAKKSTKSSTKK